MHVKYQKRMMPVSSVLDFFLGAKVHCITDYIKPFLRESANHFIIHVGTKDVSDKS